jgi:hypothetical protein
MTLTEEVAKKIIRKLLKGQDYRIEIVTLINAEFLQYVIEFFKKIVAAKLRDENRVIEEYSEDHEYLDIVELCKKKFIYKEV